MIAKRLPAAVKAVERQLWGEGGRSGWQVTPKSALQAQAPSSSHIPRGAALSHRNSVGGWAGLARERGSAPCTRALHTPSQRVCRPLPTEVLTGWSPVQSKAAMAPTTARIPSPTRNLWCVMISSDRAPAIVTRRKME